MKYIKTFENYDIGDIELEIISDYIRQGYKSGVDPNWYITFEWDGNADEVDVSSLEHVAALVKDGFVEGDLHLTSNNEDETVDETVDGWWKIYFE